MADETREAEIVQSLPPLQTSKTKSKNEKIALILTGAGGCTIEDITLKKGERVELTTAQAERFLKTGWFIKA